MAIFLVEKMKKDKSVCGKEASSPLLINGDQFTSGAILTEI